MRGGGWLRVLAVVALVTVAAGQAQQPPSFAMTPSCNPTQPLRLPITIGGRNFIPGDLVRAIFDSGTGRENLAFGSADIIGDGSFEMSRMVSARLAPDPQVGGYRVVVFAQQGENQVERVFRVPCPVQQPPPTTTTTTAPPRTTTTTTPPAPVFSPTLTLNPPMGPPGFVATAVGTGWPPGPVTIGVAASDVPITATADAQGGFRTSILMLPGTSLGPVGVQGTGAGGVTATGSFLVVPTSAGPPIWNR